MLGIRPLSSSIIWIISQTLVPFVHHPLLLFEVFMILNGHTDWQCPFQELHHTDFPVKNSSIKFSHGIPLCETETSIIQDQPVKWGNLYFCSPVYKAAYFIKENQSIPQVSPNVQLCSTFPSASHMISAYWNHRTHVPPINYLRLVLGALPWGLSWYASSPDLHLLWPQLPWQPGKSPVVCQVLMRKASPELGIWGLMQLL